MSKNTAPVFHSVVGFRSLYAGCFKGSEAKAVPRLAPSPCLTLAFLLSIPLWGAIWVVVVVVASAWPS
jgi:succinate dehydrogenase/fumarate reductase cytochrome b subunit